VLKSIVQVPKGVNTAKTNKRTRIAKQNMTQGRLQEKQEDKDTEMTESFADPITAGGATTQERTTSDYYDPQILPDYRGQLYQHTDSKLRQLDIRDIDNSLIHPTEWYAKLRRGALVLVNGTLHTFTMEDNRRVCEIDIVIFH
jgi:hypothetical protein